MSLKNKHVLIISYYWPPSGGAGVQRWVKLTKYLSRLGVSCHVITVDEKKSSYTSIDPSLEQDISPEVSVYKTNSFEPNRIYAKLFGKNSIPSAGFSSSERQSIKQKFISFVRSNLFIPDPRIGWNRYALKKAKEIIKDKKIKTLITTSPPHSTQLIGLKLKQKFDINWISDLRDPWTDIYYYPLLNHSFLSHRKNLSLEKQVLDKADHITTVSKGLRNLFRKKTMNENIKIIPNGYDPEDFKQLDLSFNENEFTITYTGTMTEQYNPEVFIEAINSLVENIRVKVNFTFIGSLNETLKTKFELLNSRFTYIPTVPHSMINKYQKNADLLLLVIPDTPNNSGILTGKLFEYLGSENLIMNIGPKNGDAAEIIDHCNAGKTFERSERREIIEYLNKLILNKKTFTKSNPNIKKYSRIVQAHQILELI